MTDAADDDLTPPLHLDRRVARAAKNFVDSVTRDGGSATITVGDKTVQIGKPPEDVPAADRTVTPEDNQAGPELPLVAPEGVENRNKAENNNVGRLKGFIERVEKLEEERNAVGSDIRDIYSELKGAGYDARTVRKLVQLRKMNAADRAEQETLLDTYKHALGMV